MNGNKADLQARLINHNLKNDNQSGADDVNSIHSQASDQSVHSSCAAAEQVAASSLFTFKDMEESISHVSGEDELDVVAWISEFEQMSTIVGWNALQKLIFAKRLLKGSARLFAKTISNVLSWSVLKSKLLREFKKSKNSAEIHNQLATRKKKSDETFQE